MTQPEISKLDEVKANRDTWAERARSGRIKATVFLGALAINGLGFSYNVATGDKAGAVLYGGSSVVSALVGIHHGFNAVGAGQKEAALEGALALHELQAVPAQTPLPDVQPKL